MSTPDAPSMTVTLRGTAEIESGLSTATLYRAMEAGELPFLKIGRRRLILRDDLRVFLEAHRVPAAS